MKNDKNYSHLQKTNSLQTTIGKKDEIIRNSLIRGAFDRSDFIRTRTVLTPDIAYDSFGKFFQIEEEEDGDQVRVFALNRKGDKIFSKSNPGEYASTEEAIGLIIQEYPQKDLILRTHGGGSSAGGNVKVTAAKRSELDALKAMNPSERLNKLRQIA